MAHGRLLRDQFYDPETVRRIATDHTRAGLAPAEVAVMDFADQVSRDAPSIGPDDIQRLRAHGLSDTDILDVALAAAARCFFSTVLDAMGAQADGALSEDLEPQLRAALTVGRAPQPSGRPTALPAAREAS
jgi:alkylhydroperoxidase family enzyme